MRDRLETSAAAFPVSLLDEIAGQPIGHSGPVCTIARLLKTLAPADAADLETALAGSYHDKAIANALRARDIMVGHSTIGRHRRHNCLCK
jgi:hypothetical protein